MCSKLVIYPDPGAVEVGLIEAGDDLLDEVAGGAKSAALAEEEGGGLGVVQGGADVQDGLQVTVYPIIPRHRSQRRRRARQGVGDEEEDRKRGLVLVWTSGSQEMGRRASVANVGEGGGYDPYMHHAP